MFAGSPKTSLLTADFFSDFCCSDRMLGRRSWRAGSVVQPVPKSMTSAGVVNQVVRWQAVKHQPSRPTQVHAVTGRLVRPVCMRFTLVDQPTTTTELYMQNR